MKKFFALLVFFAVTVVSLSGQRTVTGTLLDEEGLALIGANVLVKGTTIGTISDIDGSYSLDVPEDSNILVFSYTGYNTQEVEIGGQSVINLSMTLNAKVFEEVVITGYSTELKKEMTSSISSVKAAEIEGIPLQSFEKAIQGKAAGVQITTNSGAPGGSSEIRIRGVGSISAGSDPLIIVDGVQLSTTGQSTQGSSNPLNSINPNDIESIEILKDASSTAIYGAQGANGIIVVTTKRGKRGAKPRFQLSFQEGLVKPTNLYEMMNSQQYVDIRTEAYRNAGLGAEAEGLYGSAEDPNLVYEDWIDVLWRDQASFRVADLSFSGGTEGLDYYSSFSYNRQESQIITNVWDRMTGRFNLNATLSEKLSMSLRTSLTYTDAQGQPCDGGFFVNCPFGPSFWKMPISPARDENGNYNDYPLNGESHNFNLNQLQNAENVTRSGRTLQSINSLSLNYEILPNLIARGQMGIDFVNNKDINSRPASIPAFAGFGGQSFNRDRVSTNWNTNVTLNYIFDLGETHGLSALAGYEFVRNDFNFFNATGRGFGNPVFTNLGTAADPFAIGGSSSTNRREGFFLSGKYDYANKYIFNATVRRDGSSRFGASSRYGTFYSASVGWRVSEEDFFNVGFIDELKVRASYGVTGNSAIGDFDALAEFGTRGQYLGAPGLAPIRLANDLLGWETATQTNIGIDFAMLDSKVYGSIDLWTKDNTDLLLDTQIPAAAGLQNSTITENVGSMNNKGVDFELNAVLYNQGGFKWEVGGTFSLLSNKITGLSDGRDTIFGADGLPDFIVGRSISFFNMLDFAGVNPANGRNMVYDANGNLTYSPGIDDVKQFDGAIPDYFGGFRTDFSYKGFTIGGFLQFQGGHHVFNNDLYALASASSDPDNQLVSQAAYWRQPGDVTNVHMPINGGVIEGVSQSDFGLANPTRFYSDASYVRLKEIKVSYAFPGNLLDNIGLGALTIYAQGLNMLTWTKYDGIDPEVASTRNAFTGGSSFAFPLGKQFSAGVNVTF